MSCILIVVHASVSVSALSCHILPLTLNLHKICVKGGDGYFAASLHLQHWSRWWWPIACGSSCYFTPPQQMESALMRGAEEITWREEGHGHSQQGGERFTVQTASSWLHRLKIKVSKQISREWILFYRSNVVVLPKAKLSKTYLVFRF